MKIIRTVLTLLIVFAGFGYSQPKPAPLPESEVPLKILTNFKEKFTKDAAKWSKDEVSYQASLEKKDKDGQLKLSLFVGYDAKTGEAEFMQNGLFNIDLKTDMELLRIVTSPMAGFYIMLDMMNRQGQGRFAFLLRSFKAEGETYILRQGDDSDVITITYDAQGKVLKEDRKKR